MELPRQLLEYFYERRRLVEKILAEGYNRARGELEKKSPLLFPAIATCGPAGPNVAPFMLTFLPKQEYLAEAVGELKQTYRSVWGREWEGVVEATEKLLELAYSIENIDLTRLATHLMNKGHTWVNVEATNKATISILFPPDKGALEIRTKAWIEEQGLVYEYVNLVHDIVHVAPYAKRTHSWYPVLVMEVEEIYDNSYQSLGRRIYSRKSRS